jgi:hypothetical protein
VRETHARRRVWDANQVIASRTLNLPPGKLGLALQGLVAVGTIEFEFIGVHGFCGRKRNLAGNGMPKLFPILFTDKIRLVW